MSASPSRPTSKLVIVAALALLGVAAARAAAPQRTGGPIPPDRFVGHRIGEDRKLVRWPRIVDYFEMLARDSDRVRMLELGKTTQGQRMIAAVISSPSNLRASDQYRDVARRLREARGVDEAQARQLAESGRAIVAITLNLHSTEIGSSQMALELAYHLATDSSADTRQILDQAILLLIPSLNPDGQVMVCDWYDRGVDTALEGGRLPWLYQPYAGHDNNRDWFMLNLVETRLVTRFLYHEWFPQALHDQHQMGARGARMFVPPYFDPINPNVHPLVWRQIAVTGSEIAQRLEERNYSGVVSSATYDGWRPGDMDTTPWWHNVPALITEAASVRVATPIQQKREDLVGEQRGLRDYVAQMNFPNPWLGGWWRLRDIVDYELAAALGFLQSCARHKTDLLMNSWRMNRDAIERGSREAPYAFVIPATGQDEWTVERLLEPLLLAGVEVQRATRDFTAGGASYGAGTYIILMTQPLRPYAKDLLEAQHYPDRRVYPGGPPEVPYDEAGWTLPYKMGVRVAAVAERFNATFVRVRELAPAKGRLIASREAAAIQIGNSNAATIAVNRMLRAGARVIWGDEAADHDYFVDVTGGGEALFRRAVQDLPVTGVEVPHLPSGRPLRAPRIGVYQPWGGNPDEGWTRWVLERFEFPYTTLHNEDVKRGGLARQFDTVVLPSMRTREILTGEFSAQGAPTLPPPYAGGLGADGAQALIDFVREGGTLVALDAATEFAIQQLALPVRNVVADRRTSEFFCPGSILQVEVDPHAWLTAGFAPKADIFFLNSPAFELLPASDDGRPAAARAVYTAERPLRSGWILGEKLLDDRAALVEAPFGKGRAILVGFRAQFRGQTYGTFRVLFNAAYASAAKPAS
jgi:hypothetical protein